MARILIVPCGCRGRALAAELLGAGHAVRGTTRSQANAAVAATRPWGVDTASGTEAAPGRKDPDKLVAFFRAVEQAGAAAL